MKDNNRRVWLPEGHFKYKENYFTKKCSQKFEVYGNEEDCIKFDKELREKIKEIEKNHLNMFLPDQLLTKNDINIMLNKFNGLAIDCT